MSTDLKTELGLGERQAPGAPSTADGESGAPAGSTKQRDEFKAAFQAASAKINAALQYTAAHAEQAKHDPLAAKREKTCQAYQLGLGKIDPTNPAVAQSAIDQVLAAVEALRSTVEASKDAVQKAFDAWTAKEGELDGVTDKITEMAEWGFEKAAALQKIIEAIGAKANCRKWEEALQALQQLLEKIASIYEEFVCQKNAKEEYDSLRSALDPKLAEASTCEFAALAELDQQIADLTTQIDEAVTAKDYVKALELVGMLSKLVDEKIQRVTELEAKRAEYEAARSALDPRLAEASTSQYEVLADLDEKLAAKTTQTDEAAAAQDYEQAVTLVGELEALVDEKQARVTEIEAKRTEYEAARADLEPRLSEASTCEFEELADMNQRIADLTTKTDEAAAAQDYEQAVQLVGELSTLVDEKLAQVVNLRAKQEYESARAAFDPRLAEASVSKHESLADDEQRIATLTSEVDAAVAADDYVLALQKLNELKTVVEENLSDEAQLDRKIIGSAQRARAEKKLEALSEEDRKRFNKLAEDAKSPEELDYLTKTLAANHKIKDIEAFAEKIRGKDKDWLQNNLRLTGDTSGEGVKQQWRMSCNATTTQAVRGELDPIYALKLHEENKDITDVDDSDATKINPKLAEEQKTMLESPYAGGVAGLAGSKSTATNRDTAGQGRWADDLLNNQSDVTGVQYATKKITGTYDNDAAMADIDDGLRKGHPVPIVVGNSSNHYGHYVLVTGRNDGPPPTWTIHDPGSGKTTTTNVEAIKDGTATLGGYSTISAVEDPSKKD